MEEEEEEEGFLSFRRFRSGVLPPLLLFLPFLYFFSASKVGAACSILSLSPCVFFSFLDERTKEKEGGRKGGCGGREKNTIYTKKKGKEEEESERKPEPSPFFLAIMTVCDGDTVARCTALTLYTPARKGAKI